MRCGKTLPRRCTRPPLPLRSSRAEGRGRIGRDQASQRGNSSDTRDTRSCPPAPYACPRDRARSNSTIPDPRLFHMIRERRAYSRRARLLPAWRQTALSGSRGIVRGCRCPALGCICLTHSWRSSDARSPIAQADMKQACTRPFRPRLENYQSRIRHSLFFRPAGLPRGRICKADRACSSCAKWIPRGIHIDREHRGSNLRPARAPEPD